MAIKSPCFFLSYFSAVSVASRLCSWCSDITPVGSSSLSSAAQETVLSGNAATTQALQAKPGEHSDQHHTPMDVDITAS